jgi:hypothetical protein
VRDEGSARRSSAAELSGRQICMTNPVFVLTLYNWISFKVREFNARSPAGYLGDVDFFTWELDDEGDEDEDDEYHD